MTVQLSNLNFSNHSISAFTCPNPHWIPPSLVNNALSAFNGVDPFGMRQDALPLEPDRLTSLSVPPAPQSEEDFISQLAAMKGEVKDFIDFVEKHHKVITSDEGKIRLLLTQLPFTAQTMDLLLTNLSPKLNILDILKINEVHPLKSLGAIAPLYVPGANSALDCHFLQDLHKNLKTEDFLKFWKEHRQYYIAPHRLQEYVKSNRWDMKLWKWFHEKEGLPAHLSNLPFEANSRYAVNSTLLQELARHGEMGLVKSFTLDIPQEQLQPPQYLEEWRDCLVQSQPVDLSHLDPMTTAIGQNGCRAVIFSKDGQVHSYPGQDAKLMVQELTKGGEVDSFQIILNRGHASIAFEDGHFGFYPSNNLDKNNVDGRDLALEIMRMQGKVDTAIRTSVLGGSLTGSNPGSSSITESQKSVAILTPINKIQKGKLSYNYPNAPCTIKDDSSEMARSDALHELILTVYAPKERIAEVRKYVTETKARCESGDEDYNAFSNNCIDFVSKAIRASGIQADFRDGFHSIQYLSRPGFGNLFTFFKSNQPIYHGNTTTKTIPGVLDATPRNILKGAFVGSNVIIAYLSQKIAIPAAKRVGMRAIGRISSVATGLFAGITAALTGVQMLYLKLRRVQYID